MRSQSVLNPFDPWTFHGGPSEFRRQNIEEQAWFGNPELQLSPQRWVRCTP